LSLSSGTSAVSPDGELLLVGNLSTGMDLYDTETLAFVAAFEKPNRVNVPKQVGFVPGSRLMISGSDRGLVWLWNHAGFPVQNISHSHCEYLIRRFCWSSRSPPVRSSVQTVEVRSCYCAMLQEVKVLITKFVFIPRHSPREIYKGSRVLPVTGTVQTSLSRYGAVMR
jgi:WD40 repeat protein